MICSFLISLLLAGTSFTASVEDRLVGAWEASSFEGPGNQPERMCMVFSRHGRFTMVMHGPAGNTIVSINSSYVVDDDVLTLTLSPADEGGTAVDVSFESHGLVLGFRKTRSTKDVIRFRRLLEVPEWCSRHVDHDD